MKKSDNLVVHLTTGFMCLLSIETSKKEVHEALEEAVSLAIKNDLYFSYIKESAINDYIKQSKEFDDNLKDLSDEEILDLYNYYYIDLSEYGLFNIYVSMENTRIDNNIYDNTYLIEEVKWWKNSKWKTMISKDT